MSERRKLPPSPILRARDVAAPRSLTPSTVRTFTLPTVAALLLAAAGCATAPTGEHVHRDEPKVASVETSKPATTTAASANAGTLGGASMVAPIQPDPEQMDGQMAMVMPKTKTAKAPPTTTPPHIAPIAKPMPLGGDVAPTSP